MSVRAFVPGLRVGERIVVRCGRGGEQLAQVLEEFDPVYGRIHVRKWSWNRKRWTNPVLIYAIEIIRKAKYGEISRLLEAQKNQPGGAP